MPSISATHKHTYTPTQHTDTHDLRNTYINRINNITGGMIFVYSLQREVFHHKSFLRIYFIVSFSKEDQLLPLFYSRCHCGPKTFIETLNNLVFFIYNAVLQYSASISCDWCQLEESNVVTEPDL